MKKLKNGRTGMFYNNFSFFVVSKIKNSVFLLKLNNVFVLKI
jgi:hypothetical protein